MLPDLPQLKADIKRSLDQYLQVQVHMRLGVFSESPKHIIHEGNRMRIVRADGSIDDSELKESSAEMLLETADIPTLTLKERAQRLDEIADKMASQMNAHLFGKLTETLNRAEQTVDGKGKPFDAESVFAALEKIQLDFDETGKHHELSIVIPPSLRPRAQHVFQQIEADPELRRRYEAIIQKKRLEWRDREAARKLVG